MDVGKLAEISHRLRQELRRRFLSRGKEERRQLDNLVDLGDLTVLVPSLGQLRQDIVARLLTPGGDVLVEFVVEELQRVQCGYGFSATTEVASTALNSS